MVRSKKRVSAKNNKIKKDKIHNKIIHYVNLRILNKALIFKTKVIALDYNRKKLKKHAKVKVTKAIKFTV
jgi:hypothetical protein